MFGRGAHSRPLLCRGSHRFRICSAAPLCVWLSPHHLRFSAPPHCSRFTTPPPHPIFKSPPGQGVSPPHIPSPVSGDTQCPSPAEGPCGGGAKGGGSPLFEQRPAMGKEEGEPGSADALKASI